jgi:transposase-like protein
MNKKWPQELKAKLIGEWQTAKQAETMKEFSKRHGLFPTAIYQWIGQARNAQQDSVLPVVGNADDLKAALSVLRKHGIRLPRHITSAARLVSPKLKREDIKKLKHWCKWAFTNNERFVVGYAGGVRNAHLAFHTLSGLAGRQKHVNTIREIRTNVSNGV